MLRCGRIVYTNDLPIYAAFDAGAIAYPGTLHADVPSRLNAMLLGGELDLSPISAFAWAANADELVLLPDLCIGARDEVVSVVLVSRTPPAQLAGKRIYVTGESASGRNLLRVLLERRFGVHPEYVEETIRSSARAPASRAAHRRFGDRCYAVASPARRSTTSARSGTSGPAGKRSSRYGPRAATPTNATRRPSELVWTRLPTPTPGRARTSRTW